MILGMIAGAGVTAAAALMMGQAGQPDHATGTQTQPGRGGEYFVTGEGGTAHLWVREGMTLRHVADADRMPGKTPGDKPMDKKDREGRPNTAPK